MKSPVKYDWTSLKIFAICSPLIIGFTYLLAAIPPATPPPNIFIAVILYILFLFFGFYFSVIMSKHNIYHVKASKPVTPDELVVNTVYLLNGETHATFLGSDNFSEEYFFSIYGLSVKKYGLGKEGLLYISAFPETTNTSQQI
jgi:hypothetical protein